MNYYNEQLMLLAHNKTCTKCHKEWPIGDYYRERTRGPTKRKAQCRHCAKLAQREWRKRQRQTRSVQATQRTLL